MDTRKPQPGYTLLELAVVLTVISLVVSAIFAGKTIIKQAQITKQMGQLDLYKAATNDFQTKYGCLPGDCFNATQFFGTANATLASCITSTAAGTCNGNGDGQIAPVVPGMLPAAASQYEAARYWQQLALAALIPGSYSGASNTSGQMSGVATAGVNVPASALRPLMGVNMMYLGRYVYYNVGGSPEIYYPTGTYGHVFVLTSASWFYQYDTSLFTPMELSLIDSKYDDGLPYSGSIVTSPAVQNVGMFPCSSGSSYSTNATNYVCVGVFMTGF